MANNQGKLSAAEAQRQIRDIVEYGFIGRADHFNNRLDDEDCNDQDMLSILSKGKVKGPPEFDDKHDNWKYKVEGSTADGDLATIVVAIESSQKLKCITICRQ